MSNGSLIERKQSRLQFFHVIPKMGDFVTRVQTPVHNHPMTSRDQASQASQALHYYSRGLKLENTVRVILNILFKSYFLRFE